MINEIIENTCRRIEKCKSKSSSDDFQVCRLSRDDKKVMEKEFGRRGGEEGRVEKGGDSEFDPLKIRQRMYDGWLDGSRKATCLYNKYAKIVILSDFNFRLDDYSLLIWSWIVRAFCPANLYDHIRIFFVADDSLRRFPMEGEGDIGPQNINGGYTYPCTKKLDIFIYRIEDATRVLIHELLHAFCTDRHETGIDITEAKTEAWAELIWCCFMAEGNIDEARKNIERQIGWVVLQNERVFDFIGTDGVAARKFPWRYTIAKEDIFRVWIGKQNLIDYKKKTGEPLGESLRLTNPYIRSDIY